MTKRIHIAVATARDVAARWREQYYERNGKWGNTADGPAQNIHDRLCALGPNPEIDQVVKIIGNQSWTHLMCSGCNEYVLRAVSFKPEFSDDNILLCERCIKDAARGITRGAAK